MHRAYEDGSRSFISDKGVGVDIRGHTTPTWTFVIEFAYGRILSRHRLEVHQIQTTNSTKAPVSLGPGRASSRTVRVV